VIGTPTFASAGSKEEISGIVLCLNPNSPHLPIKLNQAKGAYILRSLTANKSHGEFVRSRPNVLPKHSGVHGLVTVSADLALRRGVTRASFGIGKLASVNGGKDVERLSNPVPSLSMLLIAHASLLVSPLNVLKLKFGTKTRAIASVGEGTTLQSALRKSQCGLLTGTHRTVNA
jgi:hypothetical protein